MAFVTTLSRDEVLVINGVRVQVGRYVQLRVLDRCDIQVQDVNGEVRHEALAKAAR